MTAATEIYRLTFSLRTGSNFIVFRSFFSLLAKRLSWSILVPWPRVSMKAEIFLLFIY
jgi:hypothetical protein